MSLPLRSCTLKPHQSRKVISGQTKNNDSNNNNNNNYLKTCRYLKKKKKKKKLRHASSDVGVDLTRNVRMEAYTKDDVK